MTVRLDIGPEHDKNAEKFPETSTHILDISSMDKIKKYEAHKNVSLDLKEEIRSQKTSSGRICIVGELPLQKQGLGRAPMIAGALLVILALNMGQIIFLGKSKGEEALATASEAFTSLEGATTSVISGDASAPEGLFADAEKLFAEATEKSQFLLNYESKWLPEPTQVKSLRNLLDSGALIASVGQDLSAAKLAFENLPAEGSLTDYINTNSINYLEPAADKMQRVSDLLKITDLSGTPYQEKFIELKEKIYELSDLLNLWKESKPSLLKILGSDTPQKYLVLLMNNDEMRPGGGFIGSYALLDLNQGKLTNFDFHDVYELDDRFQTHYDIPVHELKKIVYEWRLRDSHISPDFVDSAKKAAWFLAEEGGGTVDGVIGINLSAAQAMLEVTGSLKTAALSKEVGAENFSTVVSTLVEAKVFGKSSPKVFLKDLIAAFIEKSKDKTIQKNLGLAALLQARKKQILFYHSDPSVQSFLSAMDLDASIPALNTPDSNFLMPVFTNIGANKTDRYIKMSLTHNTQILKDNSIVGQITLKRTHTFNKEVLATLKAQAAEFGFTAWNKDLEGIMGNADNHTAIRLYIPENSRILETRGILRDEIQFFYDPLEDISYYFIDQTLKPGESKEFTISYALPFNLSDSGEFNFTIYKQPGLKGIDYTLSVSAEDQPMLSSSPISQVSPGYSLAGDLDNDVKVKLLFK